MDRELRLLQMGQLPPRHIAGAEFRVAVFAYEDPHGTELGNALAALVGRHVLLRSGVSSIGVIRYEGTLEPTAETRLSYFDKVEALTAAQEASLAVWGLVRVAGDELVIDSFVQIPRPSLETHFTWKLRLPAAMGGEALSAHLRPDRIHVQRLRIPATARGDLAEAAASIDLLRSEPRPDAAPAGRLPRGQTYYVSRRSGDWVLLRTGNREGWAPLESHCLGPCRPLLDAGQFAGGLLAHMSSPDASPHAPAGLTTEALAVEEQLAALDGLNAGRPEEIEEQSLAVVQRWIGPARRQGLDAERGIDRGGGLPPGGAAFRNVEALARIALSLQRAFRQIDDVPEGRTQETYDTLALPQAEVAEVAFDLAQASLDDPRNRDVLDNLATLFAYAGESQRADLARSLAQAQQGAAGGN